MRQGRTDRRCRIGRHRSSKHRCACSRSHRRRVRGASRARSVSSIGHRPATAITLFLVRWSSLLGWEAMMAVSCGEGAANHPGSSALSSSDSVMVGLGGALLSPRSEIAVNRLDTREWRGARTFRPIGSSLCVTRNRPEGAVSRSVRGVVLGRPKMASLLFLSFLRRGSG